MDVIRQLFEEKMTILGNQLSDFSYPRNRYVSDMDQQFYEEFIEDRIEAALADISQDYSYPHTLQHSTEEYVKNAIQQLIYKGWYK